VATVKAQTLSQRTAEQLQALIAKDRLVAGTRLPSETVLISRLGVSRTVLREAVAGLRAMGVLTSRRGSGVFVAGAATLADIEGLEDVLEWLELRSAVEVEAAGLAARRHSPAQMEAIWQAFDRLEAQKPVGLDAGDDFLFHRAIAEATGNTRFVWFVDQAGRVLIPRQRLQREAANALTSAAYAEVLQAEHEAMARAIAAGDPGAAQAAMRHHLAASVERYRAFLVDQETTQ
jgi:DNA-binding FadR family transcriptional regulator